MSMVQELGASHFAQRFAGAYFRGPDGSMMMINTAERSMTRDAREVPVVRIGGRVERVSSEETRISHEFFSDMNVLAVPRLGWRIAQRGRVLMYMSRNNTSYQRGVSAQNIERSMAPHTDFLSMCGDISREYYNRWPVIGKLVLDPTYIPLAQGLQEMNAGRRVAFAINPEVAVVPHDEENYGLMAGTGLIGTINCSTGQIEMSIPFNSQQLEEM